MRDGGKIAAAIDVLGDVLGRYQPVKTAMRDWGRRARYAGSGDRAWVSGLVLDSLRRRNSAAHHAGGDTPRSLVLGTLVVQWDWKVGDIETALKHPHAPDALTADERSRLSLAPDPQAPPHVAGDYPEWLAPNMERVFGDKAVLEGAAMAERAAVDLRINMLRTTRDQAGKALRGAGAVPSPLLVGAYHLPAPEPTAREASLDRIPAYSKGWVEVQDAGSQIAALAANVAPGDQVLDYCSGGGGKTLALAAQMRGEGTVHAYDIDGRRLSAIIPRQRRAGAEAVELIHPDEAEALEPLRGKMNLVFVDAPCSGTGTWRRRPDTKWRLKPAQLEKRMKQQDEILDAAAAYVRPGGVLLYATCSFLAEEDEDRVAAFVARHPQFSQEDAAASAIASGGLTEEGGATLLRNQLPGGAVRLTPLSAGTDGFFFARLVRAR